MAKTPAQRAPEARQDPQLERLLEKVLSYQPKSDAGSLRRAFALMSEKHEGQVRSSREPYHVHPIAVAEILADMQLDLPSVTAGLLHDLLEDTPVTAEAIREEFGDDVTGIVEGVTKLSKLRFTSKEERQAESFRKMILAMSKDIRVILVKVADRLHNMRTLEYLPAAKRRRIAEETLGIYVPLVHRLGIGRIKDELEDLAFRFADPERYERLRAQLEERRKVDEAFIEGVRGTLSIKLEEAGIKVTVQGRLKGLYSLHRKLVSQQVTMDEVYDLVAFRIIVEEVRDCYAALGIVHATWPPIPGQVVDHIAQPKENGYRSLHTYVMGPGAHPFQVQIRTWEMHREAEEGIAAHWRYKDGSWVGPEEVEKVFWLRRMIESLQETKDAQEFLSLVKMDLYPDEVYCFTPKGEVKAFPRGATPVDFAYAVHTDVGHTCVGAKVNGKLVSFRTQLRNGDIVEILTRPGAHPSKDWLKLAATSRAKAKIRQWLNINRRRQASEVGRAQLEKELRRHRVNLKQHESDGSLARALKELKFRDLDEFLTAVGYGRVTPQSLLQELAPGSLEKEGLAERVARILRPSPRRVQVRGQDDFLTTLAKCCNPIRGEAILGYITRGRGVSVHRTSCPNVANLIYDSERKIEVTWAPDSSGTFDVRVKVVSENRPGLLASISSAIAEHGTNIKNADVRTNESQKGEIHLVLEVKDVFHLETIMDHLKRLPGIVQVEKR